MLSCSVKQKLNRVSLCHRDKRSKMLGLSLISFWACGSQCLSLLRLSLKRINVFI